MRKIHWFKMVKRLDYIDLKQCIFCKKRILILNNQQPPKVGEYAYQWVNNEA